MLGSSGYTLWSGCAALIVGIIMIFFPLYWQSQWILFGLLSLLTTIVWWRYQNRKDQQSEQETTLNQRTKRLIGKTTVLDKDITAGTTRITLDGSEWSARTEIDIPKGTVIEVMSLEGIIVVIAPKSPA
ncbi:NfeD family protein [Vibrio sp. SS-MA-C1-2]|uniref:NfeD family protein n=1 Tax=Vibrio sp. SS-MA-C1-2 TaxID=2908646 RepID=UPI001F3881C6|nr:NfeD family protein [Vibrio sp. SS-MA-C1-2]UJF17008.1 NfeD family protein [Vibrio sp. SS-MA-C1-2]